ncbi:hypothetical protein [uncultured Arsenicicoccus sp.]|uniref:hypothetical protein n=1 Tax=uncultured Arsenicicoccus sp. TaxID=491339 RepID=UPI0025992D06|nr:hypothetical protein [uncultured Arsenicicoccus sp.]
MRTPLQLPREIVDGTWYTNDELDRLGVTRAQRRQLVAPHRGVYGRRLPRTLLEDIEAVSRVVPDDAVVCGESALWLHRLPHLQQWSPSPRPPIHLLVPGQRRIRSSTVRDHRSHGRRVAAMPVEGLALRVLSPPALFAQMAPHLSFLDTVILGDAVVRWRSMWTLDHLEAALVPGLPGVVQARRALTHVRPGSNSVAETKSRLLLLEAGLPEPELNASIVVDGTWLAFVDFLWRRHRLVVEYYGIHHFTSDQQRRDDLHRVRALRDHDFRVEELTNRDLADPAGMVARVARALREQERVLGL